MRYHGFLFLIFFCRKNFFIHASPEESDLYLDLLKEYYPYERPVEHSRDNVTVYVGLILQQIVDVDEKNQEVEVNAWLKMTWFDYRLRWDPSKYAGITEVRFRRNQIWTPDVLLYNSVAEEFDSLYSANVLVYSNGLATWIPPAIFKLSATIHIAWFPFDSQMCQLKFGSWTYDGSKVELRLDENGFDLSTYIPNGEWDIKSVHAERHILFYKCCVEPYFDIVFSFEIRRKTLFYGFNLIVPCIAITLLTIIGFTYPAEAGEKMSIPSNYLTDFCYKNKRILFIVLKAASAVVSYITILEINVLLSICIFQNYVSEMSPPTSESVPFLGTYFLCTILTVSLSVVGTVVIVNVHNRTTKTHKMGSKMIKVFLQKMPWLLFMRKPQKRYKPKEYPLDVPEKYKQPRETLRDLLINREKLPVKKLVQLLILERILDDVKIINSISKNEFEDEIEAREWQYMGIVFDRIALYACASFVVISTIALFVSAAVG